MTTQLLLKLYRCTGQGQQAAVYAVTPDEAINICETECGFSPLVVEQVPLERGVIVLASVAVA